VRLPATMKRDIAQPVSDLTAVAGRGAPPIDRNRLLARLSPSSPRRSPRTASTASRRSPRNGSAATPTRASRASCCCPTAQRQGHGGRRRQHGRAGARRRPAPRALPRGRDLARARLRGVHAGSTRAAPRCRYVRRHG
jgi:hypothetical protein